MFSVDAIRNKVGKGDHGLGKVNFHSEREVRDQGLVETPSYVECEREEGGIGGGIGMTEAMLDTG